MKAALCRQLEDLKVSKRPHRKREETKKEYLTILFVHYFLFKDNKVVEKS